MVALLGLGASGLPLGSLAQRVWRVGFFNARSKGSVQTNEQVFLAGMRDLGYEVGRNLIVDFRYADGSPERYPAIADELIATRPDAVVVSSTGNAVVMKNKTSTIPIVLGSVGDPVGEGIIKSLARPGGNVTGSSLQLFELGVMGIVMLRINLPDKRFSGPDGAHQ